MTTCVCVTVNSNYKEVIERKHVPPAKTRQSYNNYNVSECMQSDCATKQKGSVHGNDGSEGNKRTTSSQVKCKFQWQF